ncbi:MAG: IS1182 family transposase [Chloroflexia bacterium]
MPADHYLRRVKALIDFEAFRDLLRDVYSPNRGRPAEDPVLLVKLEFLEFHYGLSDREVIAEAQVNVAFRFFLDLSLDSPLPSPALLSQFRTRLGEERHQALFDEIVRQAREHGLVKDRLRLKDATHVVANVAVPAALELVAQVRQRLLEALRPYAPERVAEEEREASIIRTATADLKDEERLAYRVAHLQQIVAWADELVAGLGPAPETPDRPRQALERALALAHKVLAGQEDPPGPDRVRSAVDPDARRGKHGDYYDGYQLDLLLDAESEMITALEVLPGNGDEAAESERLLRAEETAHGNDVEALSTDGILSTRGEILRTLEDPQGLGVVVYAPPPVATRPEGFFGPEQFTLDEKGEVLTCPGGQQTGLRYPNTHGTGWRFHFRRSQCRDCLLLGQYMARVPAKHGRTVVKNDYQAEYDRLRARAQTARYQEVWREHPKVERKLAEIMQQHGGRRARYRGRWRVKVQYLLLGLVVNIKRMVKCLLGGPVPARLCLAGT